MKVCRECRVQKPMDAFYKALRNRDRYMNTCKVCALQYQRENYQLKRMAKLAGV